MALLDERTEFCDATSVAGDAGTALVGDVIDLERTGLNIGVGGTPLFLNITTDTEVITGGTAGTIVFTLASDAQAAIATDGSATAHIISATLVTDDAAADSAALNAGGIIVSAPLPLGTYERYLGILVTIGSTTVTAGKINAFLSQSPMGANKIYPDGIS